MITRWTLLAEIGICFQCVTQDSCPSSSTSNYHCPSSPRPRMTVNSQSGPKSPRPPDDLISTATSALRRLHFKTGRNATKNSSKQQVQSWKALKSKPHAFFLKTKVELLSVIIKYITFIDRELNLKFRDWRNYNLVKLYIDWSLFCGYKATGVVMKN